MNKLSIKLIIFLNFFFVWASTAQSQVLEDFPQACVDAQDNQPLPGHIIRLGGIIQGDNEVSFVFPDQQGEQDLQQVEIAQNVGLIGEDINFNLYDSLRPTPNRFFIVAQIFVGDDNIEPIVTCVSTPILLREYRPNYYYQYESGFNWLNRRLFIERLGWRHNHHHKKWGWKKHWRNRFDGIRDNFREYKNRDDFRNRKYRKSLSEDKRFDRRKDRRDFSDDKRFDRRKNRRDFSDDKRFDRRKDRRDFSDDKRLERRKDRKDFDKNKDRKFDRSKVRPKIDTDKPVDRKDRNPKMRMPLKKAKDIIADEKDNKMKNNQPMMKKRLDKKIDDKKDIMPNKKQDDDDDKDDDRPRGRRGR